MKPKILIPILVCALAAPFAGAWARKPIETLVVTGQNNHNWQVSHVAIERILENSGLFTVDFAVSPPQRGDMSTFEPAFGEYDLVVLDYNGDDWSEQTRSAFLEYVERGGGVVVYHAANNAFPRWAEYNKITALGGWGGRSEKSGPYVYVDGDGDLVRDGQAGSAGSHGPQHEYVMDAFEGMPALGKHPVAKGLPAHWKHAVDELYDSMRGPGDIASLLYTAYSSPEKGGTGRNEPLLFTVEYGKGRIFHTMIGHAGPTLTDNPAMQCAGFQVTLLRGAEWAATGRVKQKVPKDFPTADAVSLRKEYK